jgi:Fe-S-cluster-containing hydrogenase component 2
MLNSYTSNTLQYDPGLCNNCGMCSVVCPHGVFAAGERVAQLEEGRAALTGKKEVTCGPTNGPSCCGGDGKAASCCD